MNLKAIRTKSRIKLPSPISNLILIFLLAWAILPAPAAGLEASREIPAGTVYAGDNITVTVHIKSEYDIEAVILDENLPDGWQVNQPEIPGDEFPEISIFKASTLEWVWVENFSAGEEKTVVYNVTVPLSSKPGNFTVSGNISAYSVPAAPVKGASEAIVTYPPPEADFSADPLIGPAPLTVQFTDLSVSSPDSWMWDFDGNGSIDSNLRNPVYTYENPGTYTVVLKAVNGTYGNNTREKTEYITVTEKLSTSGGDGGSRGSGGGGGGGGAGSPELTRNIELKEISTEQVFKGIHTCFIFKDKQNEIVSVEFDPKKSFGKTTAIVEILKNTSSTVKEPAPGIIYRNVNIWVGNSGFSSPENLESARINFRVNRDWINESAVHKNTVALYRYSKNSWNPLSTTLSKEDEDYFYFTAETPGFSPFAISGAEKRVQQVKIYPGEIKENQIISEEKASYEKKQEAPASEVEKEERNSSPGLETVFVAAELLVLYSVLKRKK